MVTLYDTCKIVIGAKYSIIQDLQRGLIIRVPREVIEYFDCKKRKLLSSHYIEEIETFLLDNELGFITKEPSLFPESGNNFVDFHDIEYFILIYSKYNYKYLARLFNEISKLQIWHFEIRFYDLVSKFKIRKVIKFVEGCGARSLDLFIKYNEKEDLNLYKELIIKHPIINIIVLHSCPLEQCINKNNNLLLTSKIIDSNKHCGIIDINTMMITYDSYRISKKFNSCLYKKIAIDEFGYIKSCPSMQTHYGNICVDNLGSIINNKYFIELYSINKDLISKCKDCEYRFACSDCRAYIENPNDIYSAPLKCGYNPYNGEWEIWDSNPLKKGAIEYYDKLTNGKN